MEDREMRVQQGVCERKRERKERGKEGTSDGAWQWWELNGHAHIRRGHDSTCRLSPAGSILCAAMLFWLLFSRPHTHAHTHTRSFMGSCTLTHTQNAMDLARAGVYGRARALD